jgi:hypothetical protein
MIAAGAHRANPDLATAALDDIRERDVLVSGPRVLVDGVVLQLASEKEADMIGALIASGVRRRRARRIPFLAVCRRMIARGVSPSTLIISPDLCREASDAVEADLDAE